MGEEIVEAVAGVVEEVLRENGEEGEAGGSRGKAALLWGNVHGLVSLVSKTYPGQTSRQLTCRARLSSLPQTRRWWRGAPEQSIRATLGRQE
jgi:hypothetical protein